MKNKKVCNWFESLLATSCAHQAVSAFYLSQMQCKVTTNSMPLQIPKLQLGLFSTAIGKKFKTLPPAPPVKGGE